MITKITKCSVVALVLCVEGFLIVPVKPMIIIQADTRNVLQATFLTVAGAWLAHTQLPRLAGKQIEYNAPLFTKAVALLLCTIGVSGCLIGGKRLWNILCA